MRLCQYKNCNQPARYRVQVGAIDDKDACEEHAKELPIHWEWTAEREEQDVFCKQKLEEYRRNHGQ